MILEAIGEKAEAIFKALRDLAPHMFREAVVPKTKRSRRVLLSPGHSDQEPGASSNDGTAKEEQLTLIQASIIADELREAGHLVDIYNPQVDDIAAIGRKAAGYDLFASIHLNSYNGDGDPGSEIFVVREAPPHDKAAAQLVLNSICNALGTKNRGVKEKNFSEIAEARKVCAGPVMLIESFFLNPYNAETAKKRAVIAADAIADALIGLLQ